MGKNEIEFFIRKRYYFRYVSPERVYHGLNIKILNKTQLTIPSFGLFGLKRKSDIFARWKVLFLPTRKAIDLIPVLAEGILWGNAYNPETYTHPEKLLSDLQANKAASIRSVAEKWTGNL
jgi:hypothetical protein